MKYFLTMLLLAGFLSAAGQCRFSTHVFIDVQDDGAWAYHYAPVAVTLDYSFTHVNIVGRDSSYYLVDVEEIINEFPVQKFVYPGWVVMFSNTNFCDWIGIANDNRTVIFVNNALLDYGEIIKKF